MVKSVALREIRTHPINSHLKCFWKLLPQKFIIKFFFLKKTLSKLNSQKRHQNWILKKDSIKIAPSEKILSKLLPQLNIQNSSLKKDILKITLKRNQNYPLKKTLLWYFVLIYSPSESSEEISKLSVKHVVTFFHFQSIYFLLKTLVDNSFLHF